MQDLWCCRQLNTAEKLQKQLFRGQGYISFIEGIRTDQHKNNAPSNNQNKNTYLHSCKAIWKQLKCLLLQLFSGKVNNWGKCLLSSVLWMGWNYIDAWLMHCHEEKCVCHCFTILLAELWISVSVSSPCFHDKLNCMAQEKRNVIVLWLLQHCVLWFLHS